MSDVVLHPNDNPDPF